VRTVTKRWLLIALHDSTAKFPGNLRNVIAKSIFVEVLLDCLFSCLPDQFVFFYWRTIPIHQVCGLYALYLLSYQIQNPFNFIE
jgi:hypothetical protein